MTLQLQDPSHVEEPRDVKDYAEMLTRVATEKEVLIVRRAGADVVAIIPLDQLEILQEALAMAEIQRLLKTKDLRRIARENPPPQAWFDRDEPQPF